MSNTTDNKSYSIDDVEVESEEITIIRKGIFSIVRDHNSWFVALKNHRVSKICNTYEEALHDCENITWDRIVQVVVILTNNEELLDKSEPEKVR